MPCRPSATHVSFSSTRQRLVTDSSALVPRCKTLQGRVDLVSWSPAYHHFSHPCSQERAYHHFNHPCSQERGRSTQIPGYPAPRTGATELT